MICASSRISTSEADHLRKYLARSERTAAELGANPFYENRDNSKPADSGLDD